MRVFGLARSRGTAVLVTVMALAICFGNSGLIASSKGKYKSMSRLKAGLQGVRTAKAAAQAKLSKLLSEQRELNSERAYVKVYAAEEAVITYSKKVRPEVQQVANRVLIPTPASLASLKRRLHQQLADGEIRILAGLLIGSRDVVTTQDVEEAIDSLQSIESFGALVGAAKGTLTSKSVAGTRAEKAAEPEDFDQDRKKEVAEQIEFLKGKVAKCERDEKHIRAEIKVVSRLSDETEVPHREKIAVLQRPVSTRLTSGFGMRMHPILHEERMHKGVDFAGPYGTSVEAAATGKVTFAGEMTGYGNLVIIEHKPGFETAYGHLSAIKVEVGDRIGGGYKIGEIGSSGMSTGPHLHFEVRVNGKQVDPADYL